MKSFLATVQLTAKLSFVDGAYLTGYVEARTATAAVNTLMRKHGVSFAYRADAFECEEGKVIKEDCESVTFYRYAYRLPRSVAVQS